MVTAQVQKEVGTNKLQPTSQGPALHLELHTPESGPTFIKTYKEMGDLYRSSGSVHAVRSSLRPQYNAHVAASTPVVCIHW